MKYKPRECLCYFAMLYKGDWDDIYNAILKHEEINEETYKDLFSKLKANYITLLDKEYPQFLKNIYKPPFVLFYYGDLSLIKDESKLIGIVGSRNYSQYGKRATKEIVSDLKNKYIIVSGLAKGIDAIAHESAIENGGKTVAILGCGIDTCYPSENYYLYKEIKKNHLLMSEYPFAQESTPVNFPIRNRIVVGLSKALIVAEAYQMSGTLISVRLALETGKTVMCIPYQIGLNSMCNELIKEGAFLVENSRDIINLVET